ncbi:MAG TPA: hypothetical protein DEB39_09100 [Planctomycetaceae bacterium]|nr:hypothetical protein [Planctomycetaceae bacterium]
MRDLFKPLNRLRTEMADFSTYDRSGLRFHYPSNWMLEESGIDGSAGSIHGSIQLSSPTGAFWILNIHPFGTNPGTIAEEVLDALRDEYPDLEYEPIERTLGGRTLSGYEMHFFFLDLTNTASILCFADETSTYGVFWQCGDQLVLSGRAEEVPTEHVFEAITQTLLDRLGTSKV